MARWKKPAWLLIGLSGCVLAEASVGPTTNDESRSAAAIETGDEAPDDGYAAQPFPPSAPAEVAAQVEQPYTASAEESPDDGTEPPADELGGASAGCVGVRPSPGDSRHTLQVDGRERAFDLHVPSGMTGDQPAPLVMHFHAGSTSAALQQLGTGMNETADRHGFLLAWGEGVGGSWSDGNGEGYIGQDTSIDDVAYARALVQQLARSHCVDLDRVYATGLSSGGFLSYRIACEAPELLAAIAPVAAALGVDDQDCQPARVVPVRHFHGTEDGTVPMTGRDGQRGVREGLDHLSELAGCTGDWQESYRQGAAHCERREGCPARMALELCLGEGGGHCWPGQAPLGLCFGVGAAMPDLNANDLIWEFFSQHAREDPRP